jgi:hypothetical protein
MTRMRRGFTVLIPDKNCVLQFLSVGCGGSVVPPCLRNASHFGTASCRAFQFQIKN